MFDWHHKLLLRVDPERAEQLKDLVDRRRKNFLKRAWLRKNIHSVGLKRPSYLVHTLPNLDGKSKENHKGKMKDEETHSSTENAQGSAAHQKTCSCIFSVLF